MARLEAEVQLYRDAMLVLAGREGVEVPVAVRAESGSLSGAGVGNLDELREWLGQVLSGPLATEEDGPAGRVRSGGARRRGRVEGRGKSAR